MAHAMISFSIHSLPNTMQKLVRIFPVVLLAAALGGCETTGSGPTASAAAAPEPPMTHTKAAEICWMSTEKGHADMDLDKRVDVVDKCIAEKMNGGKAPPATASAAPAAGKKKPKS
jgi:hypothetical protein